ncbi:hypothetical protein M1349_02785 [Patescibacteria group bacterium]|nr:hypothetical protein [Patescibacteria group bacterium]
MYSCDVKCRGLNIYANNKTTNFGVLSYDETGIPSHLEPESFQDSEKVIQITLTSEERATLVEEQARLQSFFDSYADVRTAMDKLAGLTHLLFPNLRAYEQRLQKLTQYDRDNEFQIDWDKERQRWIFTRTKGSLEVAVVDWNETVLLDEQFYTLSHSSGVLTFRQKSGNGAKRKIIQAPLQVDYSKLLPAVSSIYEWEKVFTLFPANFYCEI